MNLSIQRKRFHRTKTIFISEPEAIEFPTGSGLTAHAFIYPPRHPEYTGMPGDRPPLIVISHGGPTTATTARFDVAIQYWTTRGFAVADVNYGGSSGYGRPYRERLNGQWGIVDVEDAVNAARHLVAQGKADPERLIIRGGSAGGYTALAALVFHPGVFKAAASYYGKAMTERHFGLGARTVADIEVEFNPSGRTVRRSAVSADMAITIAEDSDSIFADGFE